MTRPERPGRLPAAALRLGFTLVAPGLRILLARRLRRGKELPGRLSERFGRATLRRPPGPLLWLHAASVGETLSLMPVIHAVHAARPDIALLLTTGTVTSARLAAERLPPGARHQFVPLDVPRWVGRFLDHWRPDAAAFVESEIWPNLLLAAQARAIPLALLNARLSPSSLAAWRRAPGLARRLFGGFSLVWARSAADAARLRALGVAHPACEGDLKFAAPDLPVDPARLANLRSALAGAPVFVAASLHPGEETLIAAAHRQVAATQARLCTILVPRHPSRGPAMAEAIGASLASAGAAPAPGALHVADSLGELGLWYRLASAVFVGGSLVPHGGQNPLEPARFGRIIAMGPHTANFADAVAALTACGVLARVESAAALASWLGAALGSSVATEHLGVPGIAASRQYQNLPERAARALMALIQGGG